MECHGLLWGFSRLPCNEIHHVVTKLSFTWSVFSRCPCIQLHNCVCHVSRIWLVLLVALDWIFKNKHSIVLSRIFGSLCNRINQRANAHCDVALNITTYHIACGLDLFPIWTGHYLWFEGTYLINYLRWMLGINKFMFKMSYCLEHF
jgi:hypothetical protein